MLSGNSQWPLPPCSKPLCPTTFRASKGQLGTDAIQRKGGQVLAPHRTPSLAGGAGAGAGLGSTDLEVSSQVQACSGQSQERAAESPWGPLAIREAAANLNLAARVFRKVRQETLRFGPAGGRVLDLCPMQDGPYPLLPLPLPHPQAQTSPAGSVLTG